MASRVVTLCLLALSACNRGSSSRDAALAPDAMLPDLTAPALDLRVPDGAASSCPVFKAASKAGVVTASDLDEVSGLVASRQNAQVLWVHNDSGDTARLFAITTGGTLVGTYRLSGVTAVDWEDITVGPGPVPGKPYLYVGDFGDNNLTRATVQIHRVPEPVVDPANPPATEVALSEVTTIDVTYPEGPQNAETLMADPTDGALYIVTKTDTGSSRVYRLVVPATGGAVTAQRVTSLQLGGSILPGDPLATGGDISPAGDAVLIRTYFAAHLWPRTPGQSVAQALQAAACPVTLTVIEPQGEAVGFAADGLGFYTLSEKTNQPLYFYARLP